MVRFTLLHITWSNISSLCINKFCLHQSSWWLCRLRRLTKFCLLSWDLPIILWVTFRAHSLLFLPAKAMQMKISFANLKNLFSVICGFRFPDSGFRFRILVSDSGFRFPIPDSDFRVLGLPRKNVHASRLNANGTLVHMLTSYPLSMRSILGNIGPKPWQYRSSTVTSIEKWLRANIPQCGLSKLHVGWYMYM